VPEITRRSRFTFESSVRLKKRWEFDAIFRTGCQRKGELVRLYFLHRPGEDSKIGVVVGKKIAKASLRSRGRRMLRESLRRILPWLKKEVWIVLSLREKALRTDAAAVYMDAARLLERADLMGSGWVGADWLVDTRPYS
jgi:ribonuclease P protein component